MRAILFSAAVKWCVLVLHRHKVLEVVLQLVANLRSVLLNQLTGRKWKVVVFFFPFDLIFKILPRIFVQLHLVVEEQEFIPQGLTLTDFNLAVGVDLVNKPLILFAFTFNAIFAVVTRHLVVLLDHPQVILQHIVVGKPVPEIDFLAELEDVDGFHLGRGVPASLRRGLGTASSIELGLVGLRIGVCAVVIDTR